MHVVMQINAPDHYDANVHTVTHTVIQQVNMHIVIPKASGYTLCYI